MATFLYRCPATGYNVQAIASDHASQVEGEVYEALTCIACRRIHLVNPKTGRVAGAGRP